MGVRKTPVKSRPFHLLQPNEGSQRPQHVVFFDTETTPTSLSPTEDRHDLRLGWACYYRPNELGHTRNNQWFSFTTPPQFWGFVEAICKDKKRLYLVAHNVAFDLRIVKGFSYLPSAGWEEKFVYDKGLTTILRYKKGKRTLDILSSTNFFGMSLRNLGKLVGLEKKEVSFQDASTSQLSKYCRRDVEIIVKAWSLWIAFLDKHDLGTFKPTISSQAFSAYRHRFMDTPISIHNDMKVCTFEREAYRGGRSECFKVGTFPKEPYYYVDVNGMYAYQMSTQRYPHKLCGHAFKPTLWSLRNKLRHYAVIARVILSTEEPAFVARHNKRNVYPTGTFETVLTTPDLKYAVEHDMLVRVKEMSWYRQAFIFKSYVHYFTSLKERYEREGNFAFRGIAKLYINSLYGKFGQTAEKSSLGRSPNEQKNTILQAIKQLIRVSKKAPSQDQTINMGTVNLDTGQWIKPVDFRKSATRSKVPEETYNSFPAIVAHVTAYARHYLWQLIKTAGRKNTFYVDTDSLVVNQAGLDNLRSLIHPTKPGHLKIEKQGRNLAIYAPKDYEISDRVKTKGIRHNAEKLGDGKYRQDQFLGLAGARRRGETDLVTIKKVVKTLRREIKTGLVGKDGWVTPFVFPL